MAEITNHDIATMAHRARDETRDAGAVRDLIVKHGGTPDMFAIPQEKRADFLRDLAALPRPAPVYTFAPGA